MSVGLFDKWLKVADYLDGTLAARELEPLFVETHIHMAARQLRAAGETDVGVLFTDELGAVLVVDGLPTMQVVRQGKRLYARHVGLERGVA